MTNEESDWTDGEKMVFKTDEVFISRAKKESVRNVYDGNGTLEKMSARELNFEYVHAKAVYEQQKNRMGIFGITLTMSVIMGVWKELFSVIARGLYNWRLYQSREVELILFFVTFGVLVMTVLIGILLYKSMKKARNLYKWVLMLEEAQMRKR